ncbi:MAG: N-acetyl-gamma-glutamyl-phosphate reductase [Deltaproteobacteria bacterium]|nr:N-acetyl-gamma-glutamyl-phosphate reductase [Deltaproteobacteria bacterium]
MHLDVALFGAAGYAGLELAKLLATHPDVRLACVASDTHAGKPVGELTGRDHGSLVFTTTEEALGVATRCAAALLAVPPQAAGRLATALAGAKLVDLSHAHRATPGVVYGLTSLFSAEISAAKLVANPGCYATAVITAAAPLVRHGLVNGELVVTAGSGVTGAGRSSDEAMSLGEMYGEVRAYKVLRHQHVPEIEAALGRIAQGGPSRDNPNSPRVILTTHLLPIARGIFGTLTVRLSRPMTSGALHELFRAEYAGDPTVVIAGGAEDVSLRRVVGTNRCLVGITAEERTAVVTVALDNLLKGAAGQALENLNLMLGMPRMAGLAHLARHA